MLIIFRLLKPRLKYLLFFIILFYSVQKSHSQTYWELLNPKPTANTGKDVDFVSNNIGYIITSNELLETLDSGNSWQKKQNISSGNDMSFFNNIGFIVGNDGYVLKSTNSGTLWTQISTNYNVSFNTINIIDEDNIILSSSNSIVKSSDGGVTWQSLNIPNVTVNKTFFVNSLIGHAACNGGTMLKTIDGGQNWYVTQSTNIFPSDFFTVYFINENIGFSTHEHSEMYKTTDGGETWLEVSGISDAIYSFYFLNENIGYVTGEYGVIFKTTDGGNTWTWASFQNGRIANTSMYGLYFEDNNIGYATGARGRIIKTTDGGNTWTQHSLNYNDINNIQFFESGIGYAQVGNTYYKTSDNGNNWFFVGTTNHYTYCSGFYFVNENIGYSIGGGTTSISGDVFKTIDGGITWNQLAIRVDAGLSSVFFIDEYVGFISGGFNQRKVMKTIDGGNTWNQVFDQEFGQIQFVNEQVGYGNRIGNYFGAMFKTIDGGNTWNLSIELEGEDINAFHFVDENNGYFVGDQGLIYKTNDGGSSWQELNIPYEWYTLVNFYSKNVGYIADEDGKLYRTMNGGESWEFLTTQYGTNSIELINDIIFTAGSNGKIYRSDIEYEPVVLHINQAENISNSSVIFNGNVTSNEGVISSIQFEYSTDYSFNNSVSTNPSSIATNESLNVSVDLTSLNQNTTYYFRLKGSYNSIDYTSQILSFKTLPDYEITTNVVNNYTSSTAEISGNIVSNGNDITNVEFQYGTQPETLTNSINGTPSLVIGNSTEYIIASLVNLEPETTYFYRVKATHQGEDIYGNVRSFTTYPEYNINLYTPSINGNDVTLSAYLTSYNQDITDIVFEYGTLSYENNIATSPLQVSANNSAYISATLLNLDTNTVYYYRLKAIHNGETIYSEEQVFSLSGDMIMVSGTIESENDSIELRGLINSYGAYLTNIQFEYGITDSFGSSIVGTPNFVNGYNTNIINASINSTIANQTYYYRLVATHNGDIIYSDTYQYTTGYFTLASDNFDLEVISETCPDKDNGQLIIEANSSQDYEVTVDGTLGFTATQSFLDNYSFENLVPDVYTVCITIIGETYEQCFTVEVLEGTTVSGKSSVTSGRVSVEITTGTAPYTVMMNGKEVFETNSPVFNVDVQHGDIIEVKTAVTCEGIYSKTIELLDAFTAYPNPTNGLFEIALPVTQKEVTIALYSIHSQLISIKTYPVIYGKVQLSIEDQPTGIYIAKVQLDSPVTLKIIKQ